MVEMGPDGVAPNRMVCVYASVSLPLHHKVQKFSSGTGCVVVCTYGSSTTWPVTDHGSAVLQVSIYHDTSGDDKGDYDYSDECAQC